MNEFEFRNDITKLKRYYLDLDRMKYQKIIREGRIMKPTPGWQLPAQSWPMNTKIDLEAELHEVAADVRNHIAPNESLAYPEGDPREGNLLSGPDLCQWLYEHANPLAELVIADETIGETVRAQISYIARHIPQEADIPQRLEPWQLPSIIIQKLKDVGVAVTEEQLRQWASRGHINAGKRNGRNTYRLSDVAAYLKKESSQKT